MIKAAVHTKNYFQAPKEYFWHWTDKGTVAEWYHGSTICYRDDLVQVLTDIAAKGLPPLGSLLLLLSACREEFTIHHKFFLIKGLREYNQQHKRSYELIDRAMKFSKIVYGLPEALRTGYTRVHLVQEVFADGGFIFSGYQVKEAVSELAAGRMDELIFSPGEKYSFEEFNADIRHFADALDRFPDTTTLETKLRTGLYALPGAATIQLPDESASAILDQLADDPRTAGMARLTRRLVAAMIIPLHSQNSGDQSYGGITDITNRGNYDKLLLSELAHDTDLLMARLVNNEALYYKREQPPDNPKRKRIILLDTTLKLWGVPRVFALSAALAFAQNKKHEETTAAYALGGEDYKQVELDTKPHIIAALESLHHALHCGRALQKAIKELGGEADTEFVFISMNSNLLQPAFAAAYASVRDQLNFVVTVDRSGEFSFSEVKKGRNKLLNTARFDLDEILFPKGHSIIRADKISSNMPEFLLQSPPPLLFPKVRIGLKQGNLFYEVSKGTVAVTETWRLLYILPGNKGADELLSFIEKGTYYFAWDDEGKLQILVYQHSLSGFKLYSIDPLTHSVKSAAIPGEITGVRNVVFNNRKFYVETGTASFAISCSSFEIVEKRDAGAFEQVFLFQKGLNIIHPGVNAYTYNLQQHFNVMFKVKDVYVNKDGKLALGNYALIQRGWGAHKEIRVIENVYKTEGTCYAKDMGMHRLYLSNRKIKFSVRRWPDGSEAVIDSRGLVHLRSADSTIPEITFVIITGGASACWASDGAITGNDYFLRDYRSGFITEDVFYERYIQRFIDKLLQP